MSEFFVYNGEAFGNPEQAMVKSQIGLEFSDMDKAEREYAERWIEIVRLFSRPANEDEIEYSESTRLTIEPDQVAFIPALNDYLLKIVQRQAGEPVDIDFLYQWQSRLNRIDRQNHKPKDVFDMVQIEFLGADMAAGEVPDAEQNKQIRLQMISAYNDSLRQLHPRHEFYQL